MDEKITIEQVAEMLGVSKRTAWRRTKQESFPRPIRETKKVRGMEISVNIFKKGEILDWLKSSQCDKSCQ